MLSVKSAVYQKDFKIEIEFSDGKVGIVDLEDLVYKDQRPVFRPLRDVKFFQEFKVDYTLSWSESLDLAPEYLYFLAFKNEVSRHEQFVQWGYVSI